MVKRAIFYDDCRDASRLAAEWTQTTPAAWSVYNDGTRFSYRCSTTVEINTLMSILPSKDFEIYMKIKSASVLGNIGVLLRKARNAADADTASVLVWFNGGNISIYIYDGSYQILTSVAFAWSANQWYEFRGRVRGETFQAKAWLLGTPEPDWIVTTYNTRQTLGGRRIAPCTIGTRQQADIAGVARDYADIRVYPIPRTGGGMAP
jgi:hypothetical protein